LNGNLRLFGHLWVQPYRSSPNPTGCCSGQGFRGHPKGNIMRYLKYVALLGILVFVVAGSAKAQVAVRVGVGPVYGSYYEAPPVCDYGYFDYYPYDCAPYGYWGPDYFVNGVFIGVGPWYGRGFYGRGYYGRGYYGRGGYGRGYYGRP